MNTTAQLGETIAFYRRRRGLSQVELARLLDRSESWVSQVERGARSIDRLSVLQHLADVLNIPPSELLAGAPLLAAEKGRPQGIEALRLALSAHPGLIDIRHVGRGSNEPSQATELQAQVAKVWPLVHASRYGEATSALAELVPALEAAARQADESQRPAAFGALATVYQAAAALLTKVREVDAAWVAADRAVFAAEQAGGPLLAAAGDFRLAHTFLGAGWLAQAEHAAKTAASALEKYLEDGSPELVSLWGAFNLVLAIVAARKNDQDMARDHLREAETAAQRVGEGRNDFGTEFGPANVTLHRLSVEVELGNAGEALRIASAFDGSTLSPERRARFLIDVARAYTQRRRTAEALHALEEAESLAPEQVRDHRIVREMVRDLMQGPERGDPRLLALAQRVNVRP